MSARPPAIFGGLPLYPTRLPLVRPVAPPATRFLEDCRSLLARGHLTNGQMVRKLEAAAARYLEVPECVAVSSGTAGLMLVERCVGLKGSVIVPSFTFFATAHSLLWNNLEPVLVDCDADTWNLDPVRVRSALRPGVTAILAVHLYGNPAAVEELEHLASRAGICLILDAAHAFGARRGGRSVGGWGDAEIFSLSPTKLLVAGEGGLIATRNPWLARDLRAARNYGDAGDYDCRILGLNARLTEFQAALALAGLPQVDRHVDRRNRLAGIYEYYLCGQPGLAVQKIRPQDRSSRKDFSIVLDEATFGVSAPFLVSALCRSENRPLIRLSKRELAGRRTRIRRIRSPTLGRKRNSTGRQPVVRKNASDRARRLPSEITPNPANISICSRPRWKEEHSGHRRTPTENLASSTSSVLSLGNSLRWQREHE